MCSTSFGCPICMSEYAPPCELGSIDACQHMFCFSCIKEWLDTCSRCPICKQEGNTLYKHELTEEAHSLFDGEHLGMADAHSIVQKQAPHSSSFLIEKRQLAHEDPDPGSIPDPGHSDICEVCQIDTDDELCLLCDSCNRCFHTYCVNLTHVPEGRWYCPDCDVRGQFAHSRSLQTQLQEQSSRSQAANVRVLATRGSAVQLNNRLPRVRSRTTVRAAQPRRAVNTACRPECSEAVLVSDDSSDSSDTDSWNSATPIALLRPSLRDPPETAAQSQEPDEQSHRCTERSTDGRPQCNTARQGPPHAQRCSGASSHDASPHVQHSIDAGEPVQLRAPQRRPRMRPGSARAERPICTHSHTVRIQAGSTALRDPEADDCPNEAAPQPLGSPRLLPGTSRSAAQSVPQPSPSHKRLREALQDCIDGEASPKSVRLQPAICSHQACTAGTSRPVPGKHNTANKHGHLQRSASPCLQATGPSARLHAVRLAHASTIPKTCSSSRMRSSAAPTGGSHPLAGSVRIRNTTTHQGGVKCVDSCCEKVRPCSAAMHDGCRREAGPSVQPQSSHSVADGSLTSVSTVLTRAEMTEKAKKREAKLKKSSKAVAHKLLQKVKANMMVVDAVHPTKADEVIAQATVCVADGIVAEQSMLNHDTAQRIAQSASGLMAALFSSDRAVEKAQKYMTTEIVRFAEHVQRW